MAENTEEKSTITVTGVHKDLVGLWEIDPAHPDGEVLVKYESPVEAAETQGVLQALAEGRIKKAEQADQQKADENKAAQEKATQEAQALQSGQTNQPAPAPTQKQPEKK